MSVFEEWDAEAAERPISRLPDYELIWKPDMTTRRSGWWTIAWASPLPKWNGWRFRTSGYSFTRGSAEREVRRIVKQANRGLSRTDWENA